MSWVTEHISDDPEVLGDILEALVDKHYGADWGAACAAADEYAKQSGLK
jgi:hypothetical protein